MTMKLDPRTNHITSMSTTELHVFEQQHTPIAKLTCLFHVSLNISNTIADMYIKLHKYLDFDGPMCTHVFKCL